MSNSIVRTEHGAFCAACQSLLSIEEEDFGVCDACDGEGIGGDDEDECYCDFESREFFGCFDRSHAAPCPQAPASVQAEKA